jgi:hypothetical protein
MERWQSAQFDVAAACRLIRLTAARPLSTIIGHTARVIGERPQTPNRGPKPLQLRWSTDRGGVNHHEPTNQSYDLRTNAGGSVPC